ncbi:MAG: 2-dehydro-3-deoxy-6-phosphogalactonate aldolase [Gammaproteobacteria bacterium]|nr:2-dehydro-3-deoxy-6-phosphogalactonate aldolase [Gammaproteobacteria bacterium]
MVSPHSAFDQAFTKMPLVAILRGVRPDEIIAIADVLIDAGFTLLEVPLNSPDAFTSIERLVAHCPDDIVIGAGTVLQVDEAIRLSELGARLMVTPNTNPEMINTALEMGLIPLIGCMTPSEVLLALRLGASAVKIFPAGRLGPAYAADLKALLPVGTRMVAVGGVGKAEMEAFKRAGYDGFGFGSSLYTAGRSTEEVSTRAQQLVGEWKRLCGV